MRRAGPAVAFVAAALIALVAAAAPAAAGKFGDIVNASVPPGAPISPQGHYYLVSVHPGETVTEVFRVGNPNDHPITANIEAVDATTADVTGSVLGRPGSAKALISRWIVVSAPQITLAPKAQRDVPFMVHVPAGTKPGQYLAGMSASVPLSPSDTSATLPRPGYAGFSMSVEFQRGIAVEIDVPGPRAPNLVVSGADPVATPNGVSLGVHIANQGNAFAHGSGVIRVADTNTDFSFTIKTFVTGTAIVYPMQWTKAVVPGTHHVEVDLTYDGGRRTSWTGTVVIAGSAANQLENALKNVTVRGHGPGSWPLLLLAAALAVVLVVASAVVRRRSRRSGPVNYRAI